MILTTVTAITTCGHPPSPPSNGYLISYTSTMEGTIVTYVVHSSYHIGDQYVCTQFNRTAICTKEGNWRINSDNNVCAKAPGMPLIFNCCHVGVKENIVDCTVTGKTRTTDSEGLDNAGKIAVASSSVFTVSSITFFIAGCLCGYLCQKKQKLTEDFTPPAQTVQTPLYDEIMLKQRCHEHKLEPERNMAYIWSSAVTNVS